MGCCPSKKARERSSRTKLNEHGSTEADEEDALAREADDMAMPARKIGKSIGNGEANAKKSGVVKKSGVEKGGIDIDGEGADIEAGRKSDGRKSEKVVQDNVKLQIMIKNATNLREADMFGHSDPFCIMEIPGRGDKPKVHVQTEVVDDNCNPTWNHKFECNCAVGDPIHFSVWDKDVMTEELLGKCKVLPTKYFPFGFHGELRLDETGEDIPAHLNINIKVLEAPHESDDDLVPDDEKTRGDFGIFSGIDPLSETANLQKAEAVIEAMEADMNLQKEDAAGNSLDALVRLAESPGMTVPKQAIERVVSCLQASDRRYRLAALRICKALGNRCQPFAKDFARVLHDNDQDVRIQSCKILGSFGDYATPYVDKLGSLLQDEFPAVRSAALEALGVLSQADNVEALLVLGTCLRHRDNKYRLAACLILKALGIKATPHADLLVERIEMDHNRDVRIAACSALGSLGAGANSVQAALSWLYYYEHDSDRHVAKTATEMLKKLKAEGRHLPDREKYFKKGQVGYAPPKSKERKERKESKDKDDKKTKSNDNAKSHDNSKSKDEKQSQAKSASNKPRKL